MEITQWKIQYILFTTSSQKKLPQVTIVKFFPIIILYGGSFSAEVSFTYYNSLDIWDESPIYIHVRTFFKEIFVHFFHNKSKSQQSSPLINLLPRSSYWKMLFLCSPVLRPQS